jgi:amino acid adenylation domain-containing protein
MHARSTVGSEPVANGIHHVIDAQARERPDAPAVVSLDGTLSYEALNHRANAIAARLQAGGVGPNDIVGLVCPSSLAMVVGALGILKAGGAYLPIDPGGPPDRIAAMLADAAARWVVGIEDEMPPAGAWRGVTVDRRGVGPEADTTPRADPTASLDRLAYVIFTSGSTGRPKGVLVTHRNLVNLVRWHQEAFAIVPADRAMQVTSVGFDAAVWEIWPYLMAGASVHIAEPDVRSDPRALRDWVIAHRITIGFAPTMMAERLIASDWPAETSLRVLLTGADALRRYPPPGLPFDLINNYGPTEGTVVTTSGRVPPASGSVDRPPTIGRPIANVQVHILDEDLSPVPVGATGEIYIGGAGVSRGYLGQPGLTAERFVPDPFSGRVDARLYKTGDRGCRLPNGEIAFHGRVDDQVKVRGYRIELGEVAFALNRHPAVRDSTIVARETGPDDTRLVAYLVLAGADRPTPTALRRFLEESLPQFMLPSAFVVVSSLPVNANGKVDRAALPAPDARNVLADAGAAVQSALEQQVVELLSDLLNVETIGVGESFFHLGGHSLLAAQVIARVSEQFGVELPLRTLFDHPTPRALAAEIESLVLARIEDMSDEDVQASLAAASEEAGR